MRTGIYAKRIFTAMICIALLAVVFSFSAIAAKEMFMNITEAGITELDAPVAGQRGDYSATPIHSGKYDIEKIEYYEADTDSLKNETANFKGGTAYYALITLKTKSAYYVTYSSTGAPNATVTCNGNTATAVAVVPDSKNEFAIKYEFPKTENVITEVNITGVDKPVHDAVGDTSFEDDNVFVTVGDIQWKNQSGSEMSGGFKYGESYVLTFYLFVNNSSDFAKDYSHPLATSDKPMPAVTVKVDGVTATVMPDYGRNQFMRALKVSVLYTCNQKVTVDRIKLDGIVEPRAGGMIDYDISRNNSGYSFAPINDEYNKNGIAWRVKDGMWLTTSTPSFNPNETYQISVRLIAESGYEFPVDENGSSKLIATVNNKDAVVNANKNEAIITYTFPATENILRSVVSIFGIDAPKVGDTPDYDGIITDDSLLLAEYNNATTKNGITWYCDTDKKAITTNQKFEADKIYSVHITFRSAENYEFEYKNGVIDISGFINGQEVNGITSRDKYEATVYYTFPKAVEEKHVCSPIKVDEVKATCSEVGKKSYYFCPECGKNFEDSDCKIEIPDVNAWGDIEKLDHKGGTATCLESAKCEICGESYGEINDHEWGTRWDYKDAVFHAHVCKVCGMPDSPEMHIGGTAECGKLAKCSECNAEYGEVMQHIWTDDYEYRDSKGHAHKCINCGEHDTVQAHTGGTADCQNKAICEVCNFEYGRLGSHTWSNEWDYTSVSGHAHKCTVEGCNKHDNIADHIPGPEATESEAQLCTVCGFIITPANNHVHELTKISKVDATCTKNGNIQHFVCEGCGKLYKDAKGTKEITDAASTVIEALGHKESEWKTNGDIHWKECTVEECKAIIEDTNLGHEYDENGKCIVCGYVKDSSDLSEEKPESPDIKEPDENVEPDESVEPDEPKSDNDVSAKGGSTIWIIIAAVLAVCCIAMGIVIVKKSKK